MLGDRWGVSDDETRRRYPCDDFVPAPNLRAWRGVSVDAPPSAVWRWVAQIRLAPYSYDWIDNLGRRSPQRLVNLPEPVVGEAFTTAGGRRRGRILAVEPVLPNRGVPPGLTGTIVRAMVGIALGPGPL
ncbi:polyketide cyclase [Micromonospora sp. WMMD1274]|uniref:polyketide cyclase n=1 Tax=Micromonospora sp. WMMD1274 TaxID=3404116 RepID=UPI003B93FF54